MKSHGPPPAGGFGYPNPPGEHEPAPPPRPRGFFPGRSCGPTPLLLLCALGLVRFCAIGAARAPAPSAALLDPGAGSTFEMEAPTLEAEPDNDLRDWVAVDDARVYVADAHARAITARPKTGGEPTTLAELPAPLEAMTASADGVTYATFDEGGAGGSVYRVSVGTEPRTIAQGLRFPERLAAFAGNVYASVSGYSEWTSSTEDELPETGRIVRLAAGEQELVLARAVTEPMGLVVDAEDVYFADHVRGEIHAVPRAGGPERLVAEGMDDTRDMAIDDDAVYVTDGALGVVYRIGKRPGEEPVAIAAGRARPRALAVSGPWVYWVDDAAPTGALIVRVDKRGGEPTVLATGRVAPANLVVDGGRVLWAEAGAAHWVSATATPAQGEVLPVHTLDEQPIAE